MGNEGEAVAQLLQDKKWVAIKVFVATRNDSPIFEELPAYQLSDNAYELLASPGLALNLAKGDIVEIIDREKPARVLKRGGNFCINIYTDEASEAILADLGLEVQQQLHGTLDGRFSGSLALSVPASVGIHKINEFFDAFRQKTGWEWYFSNIYANFADPEDETLLDWWVDGALKRKKTNR
jgi:hypothetical protein